MSLRGRHVSWVMLVDSVISRDRGGTVPHGATWMVIQQTNPAHDTVLVVGELMPWTLLHGCVVVMVYATQW